MLAIASAAARSFRYSSRLEISASEWIRYLKKSANFAICYKHLGAKQNLREAWLAGNAAFVCCAYDVATDWRSFDNAALNGFSSVLSSTISSPSLRDVAMDLYEKEKTGNLVDDGLERGWIALRFTLRVMECEEQRAKEWGDIDDVGRMLQIVDDVLDFEDDVRRGEMNCLTSANRLSHVEAVISRFDDDGIARTFGARRTLLTFVLRKATAKATDMRVEWSSPNLRSVGRFGPPEILTKVP